MTDLDRTFRAAIDAAARDTVAPPLTTIARRARVYRARRVATGAAGTVLAVTSLAIAVPRLATSTNPAGPGALRPATSLGHDRKALARYRECRAARPEAIVVGSNTPIVSPKQMESCLRQVGYAPPPPSFPEPCLDDSRAVLVTSGSGGGRSWRYEAYPSLDAGDDGCERVVVDGRTVSTGTLGGNGVMRLYDVGVTTYWLVYGTTTASGEHADVTVDDRRHYATVVAVPGRDVGVYAVGLTTSGTAAFTVSVVVYDANGAVVSRLPARQIYDGPPPTAEAPRDSIR